MERFAQAIIRLRGLILTVVFGLTLFFGYQIKNLRINSDIISTMPDDDPTAHLYKEIGERYGGNEIGMIVLETGDVFNRETLQHIKQVTDSVKITGGVSTVTSLTDILDIKSSDWGIEIGKLVDEYDLPEKKADLDSLKAYVLSKEMYRGVIVSGDATATVILFTVLPDADKQEVANTVKAKVSGLHLPETVYFGGLPFLLNDVTDLILSDMLWLIPIVFVVIALILLISFRSLRGMLLPLFTAGISVIWTLGIMACTGYKLTIISNFIPVILLAIGSAYTIHVLHSIDLFASADRKQTIVRALAYTLVPVLLASVTTAIGFVSFVFGAFLTMTRDFGICTSIGILIALLLSLFFIPALIAVLPGAQKKRPGAAPEKETLLTRYFLRPLNRLLFHHPARILVVWGILLLTSIGGIFLIKTSVNITNYFKKDNPTRVSENILQQKFGGSLPVFIECKGDMQDPAVLQMMVNTEDFMEEDPNISSAQSIADLVAQMNNAMGEGEQIPDSRAKVEQLWFLLEGQDVLQQLVTEDLDRGVIQSKFASIETDAINAFTQKMSRYCKEHSNDRCTITFTGIPPLYVKLNNSLVKSQYSSLIIAIIMVLVFVGLIMHSFTRGLFAIIPIIATIIISLGFMGFTGIALDIATVLVGSIALGIGIDYAIHIISGFNVHLRETGDVEQAIEKTLMSKGKAVVTNVLSVAAGFLILLFANILPIQNFGLLIAISMVGSGLGALTLLPVLLILAHRNHNAKKSTLTDTK